MNPLNYMSFNTLVTSRTVLGLLALWIAVVLEFSVKGMYFVDYIFVK